MSGAASCVAPFGAARARSLRHLVAVGIVDGCGARIRFIRQTAGDSILVRAIREVQTRSNGALCLSRRVRLRSRAVELLCARALIVLARQLCLSGAFPEHPDAER